MQVAAKDYTPPQFFAFDNYGASFFAAPCIDLRRLGYNLV